ncbi:Aconitate hydratase A [Orientia tsutsugamushi]|uniref:aconitate hydratase n=1 Tax=Orientia tsutsugamushi TaxID=784 RepID=A0A2U3RA63_ORITS|nr:aconitase family protein [Orientia tsutsugamushi str. UT76]SPR10109.1 Aconitate hydratase A [Orientia tsutsugamushi]
MCPEFGATCAYFPIDQEIIKYLTLTSRKSEDIELVEKYAKKQLLWRNTNDEIIIIVVMFKLSHYHIL